MNFNLVCSNVQEIKEKKNPIHKTGAISPPASSSPYKKSRQTHHGEIYARHQRECTTTCCWSKKPSSPRRASISPPARCTIKGIRGRPGHFFTIFFAFSLIFLSTHSRFSPPIFPRLLFFHLYHLYISKL